MREVCEPQSKRVGKAQSSSFVCRRQLRGLEKDGICIIINIYFTLSLPVSKASQFPQNFKLCKVMERPCPQAGSCVWKGKDCEAPSWGHRQIIQLVKNPSARQETLVQFLSQEDPLEKGMATHSSILAWRIPMERGSWSASVHGITKGRTRLSDEAQDTGCWRAVTVRGLPSSGHSLLEAHTGSGSTHP